MRNKTIITLVLLGFGLSLAAQQKQEALLLLTDRGHYISGETINYRAIYRKPEGNNAAQWSRILYLELILPNGTALAQGKVLIDSSGAMGSLAIPEGLSSGTYYLKAYTRWMRNCGPEGFVYTSVQIYDPYNDQIIPEDSSGWKPIPVTEVLEQAEEHTSEMLGVKFEQDRYQTRQEVVAELSWEFPYASADLTLSVARVGLSWRPKLS